MDRGRSVVIDRSHEPYLDMDHVTGATRRQTQAAPPMPKLVPPLVDRLLPVAEPAQLMPEQPAPIPDSSREATRWAARARPSIDESQRTATPAPDDAFAADEFWARTAPSREDESYAGPSGYRGSPAWLVLTMLLIGGSAAYLGYAAIVAPETPGRTVAPSAAASLPDTLGPERVPESAVAALPVVAPPALPSGPAASPEPAAASEWVMPPEPAAPDGAATPTAWTVAPAVEPHPPAGHRPVRRAHVRKVEHRSANQQPHDRWSWLSHPFGWLGN